MTNHPITPPPELVEQWAAQGVNREAGTSFMTWFATQAARWGADQELEACCEWLDFYAAASEARDLRAARRPKPPSLKEQALRDLDDLEINLKDFGMGFVPIANLRKALEALPND